MKSDKFHLVILPLKQKLFRFALSIVHNRQEAEDILQDVFLKLWDKRDEWDRIEYLEAYCFRAVKNLSVDRVTSISNKKESSSAEMEINSLLDTRTPFSSLIDDEKQDTISRCLNMLPDKQKEVFQLREIEEMSYKEISDLLGISDEQVKVSLFRARKKMKELLSGYYEE